MRTPDQMRQMAERARNEGGKIGVKQSAGELAARMSLTLGLVAELYEDLAEVEALRRAHDHP